jgi:hypothetical protein
MMTMPEMAADMLGRLLAEDVRHLFGSSHHEHVERLDDIRATQLLLVALPRLTQQSLIERLTRTRLRRRDPL